ncbi:MAG: hypothetical protein GEU87_18100 [Alphaproteobacteria bacterium]|nr:hypothetical protein [Alphaproteobacteria bacterium]
MSRDRYGCRNHFRRGSCENSRTVSRSRIEQRVLAGLRDKLVSPESVARAALAFYETLNRENRDRRAQADADRQTLAKVERAIQSIVKAIEDGMYQPVMKARMDELHAQKAEIEARLREALADIPDINPNIAELYRKEICRITELLDDPDFCLEAAQDVRALIGEVILTPVREAWRGHGRSERCAHGDPRIRGRTPFGPFSF